MPMGRNKMAAVSPSQIKTLCRKAKYKDETKVIEDLRPVFQRFPTLKLLVENYVFTDGSEKTLLNLAGTVPVCFQGNNYNIPIRIWFERTHPEDGPICYVEPTSDMYVEPSQYVDREGKIYLPYLHEWNYPAFTTAGLLGVIIAAFSEKMPVYARSSSRPLEQQRRPSTVSSVSIASLNSISSMDSNDSDYVRRGSSSILGNQPYLEHAEQCKGFIHTAVKNYKHKNAVKRDVHETLADYRNLNPRLDDKEDSNGRLIKTMNLTGTVPITYQGNVYNIPICVWIPREYPDCRPLCFLRPTPDMAIKASPYVDPAGKILLPYLQHWKHPNSDLRGLIQVMSVEFGKDCPIYSANASQPSQSTPREIQQPTVYQPLTRQLPQTPAQLSSSSDSSTSYMSLQQTGAVGHYMALNEQPPQPHSSYYNIQPGMVTPEYKPGQPQSALLFGQMANRPLPALPPNASPEQQRTRSVEVERRAQELKLQAQHAKKLEEEKKELQEKARALEDKHCCPICMETTRDVAFQCGHMTCRKCSELIHKCPICRTAITQRINLYH
ncbi:uncharacterized protein LOC102802857 [Saccoglossus kowalevskii]|uniref:Uncharacterized protein LOC102802857 n=1 Tax=Saccoglossus kowalevskii TaxID=10224 RepID=A0ABM0M836_SACKO|nr:PREDICTED: uncharacterized protein LOC102802857 [Saccoglossus kowalevskii]